MKKQVALVSVMLVAVVAFAGCGKKEAQEAPKETTATAPAAPAAPAQGQQLVLAQIGPQNIKAGADFNVQPNGESAMWAKGENITRSTVIVVNNEEMKSSPKKDGKNITCFLPKKAYATAGEYPVFLLDKKTGSKSAELKLVVK